MAMFRSLYILLLSVLLAINLHAEDEIKLFSLFPVPLKTSRLTVRLNIFNQGVRTIEVRNLIGKKIQEKQFPIGTTEIYFDDIDTNPNGVYVVLAKDANGKILEISKFVLNK